MKRSSVVIALAAIAIVGWKIGGILSRDALSLMLGVIFGLMAGIPAALVALSSNRTVRREDIHRVAFADQRDVRPLPPAPSAPRSKITIVHPGHVLLSVGNQQNRIEVRK